MSGFPHANFFIVGGVRSPGKATLLDGTRSHGWDQRKGYGLSGAYSVPTGEELVEPRFLIELWDPEDWPLWLAFAKMFLSLPVVRPPGGLSTLGLGILHPVLNAPPTLVHKVMVKSVTPMIQDEYGIWSSTITFIEFRPPKDAPARPLATIPDAAKAQPTAKDMADAEMQARSDELAAVMGP